MIANIMRVSMHVHLHVQYPSSLIGGWAQALWLLVKDPAFKHAECIIWCME